MSLCNVSHGRTYIRKLARTYAAAYLRTVAEKLEADGALRPTTGEQSCAVDVPDQLQFEVKVERESGQSGDKVGVEFELAGKEGAEAAATGPLEIE